MAFREWARVWLTKPDTYPIIGICAFGLSWMTYKGIEHISAPDVFFNPSRRSADATLKYDPEEGEKWRTSVATMYRHKEDEMSNLSIFEPLKPSWWAHRSAVRAAPMETTRAGLSMKHDS